MATTLKDIAKTAGVSVTTVSLVLRDNPHPMISQKTREKVMEVARELKYRHNLHARALRMGKSQLIGLMMFDFEARIALSKLEAIDDAIGKRGYRSLIRTAAGHTDMVHKLLMEYGGGAVEGLIVMQPPPEMMPRVLETLNYGDIPILTLERIEGVSADCVTVDRKYGAYIAIKHLLELGHRRIAILHGHHTDMHVAPRLQGYRQALEEFEVSVEESLMITTKGGYGGGYDSTVELLKRKTGVTALFCDNDENAVGAMKALREFGVRVPEDIAVIGFDNIEAGAYAPVPLTTVAQPVDEVAVQAIDLLFKRMENGGSDLPPQLIRLKPRLVIRESCGGKSLKSNGQKEFCA